MQELEFKIQVGEARIATAECVRAVVLTSSLAALEVVTELMRQAESESVRLSAARTLLHHAEVNHYVRHDYISHKEVGQMLEALIQLAESRLSPVEYERLVRDFHALIVSLLA